MRRSKFRNIRFFSATSLKNIRFAHRYYAAQMLTLSDAPGTSDVGYSRLKRTYKSYEISFPNILLEKTRKSLTLLKTILGSDTCAIRSKSDILILHLIAFNLLSGYSINGFEQKIGQFILEFISKVGKESSSANERSTDPFVRYAYFRKFRIHRSIAHRPTI